MSLASSLKFKLFGTDVNIHWSVLLIYLLSMLGTNGPIKGFFVATALLCFVLAHEYGHVFMARHYGNKTHSIALMALGGNADIRGNITASKRPAIEAFLIACAGPAVSIVLAALFLIPGILLSNESLALLGILNAAIAIFNLLPIFPMDGGRMIHSVFTGIARKIAHKYPKALRLPKKATLIVSVITCVIFGIFAIYMGQITAPLIILFVAISLWSWNKQEEDSVVHML